MDFVDHGPAEWNLEMGGNQCEHGSVDPPQFFITLRFFRVYSRKFPKTHMELCIHCTHLTFTGVERIKSINLHEKIPLPGFIQGCSSKEIPVENFIMSWPRGKSLQSSTAAHAYQWD